ncbi:restriction endonuclease subunit S [Citricoccus nitrophenolicus]
MSLNFQKSTWQQVRLGDVARHITDRVNVDTSGLTRFLAGGHIPSGSLHIHDWGDIGRDPMGPMFYKRFAPGHVLYVSRRTYLRKVAVPDFTGITGEKTFVLETSNPSILLQEFLPFVLSAERFHEYAILNSRGSVNPYLNWSELAAYEFQLPPLGDQQRIANLLWTGEHHMRSLRHAVHVTGMALGAWLEKLVPSIEPWVGLDELITEPVRNGISLRSNSEEHGIPTLSISAIRDGAVVPEGSIKYVNTSASSVDRFVIQPGDFFVVRGNGNRELVAKGGLVSGEENLPEGAFYPDLLMRVRFDSEMILPAFGALMWNSRVVHASLVAKAKSTNGTWKVNGKDLASHRIPVPSVSEQQKILGQARTYALAKNHLTHEMRRLEEIRQSILTAMWGT